MSDKNLQTIGTESFENLKKINEHGAEYWSARDLQTIFGYHEWRKFENSIKKAIISCQAAGNSKENHFVGAANMVKIGSDSLREVTDYHLSRFACYLIAQNGDPRKAEIASAQQYFAIQTRRQELADAELSIHPEDLLRLGLRDELSTNNKILCSTAKLSGIETSLDYAVFQDQGYKGLYDGKVAKDIHKAKRLKKSQKILDHMGSAELAANLFRATQTEEILRRNNIQGKDKANDTHFTVGQKVRQTICELGGTMPEELPTPDKSIKQIKRQRAKQLSA